ncbi:hypothetical protein, partial [Streptomyces sp. NPDC005485]|uniref:hypothetical protein n=1 Tax=Streptomyces sp. NPDC005485 TaxID=3155591 RepID=UPI0033A9E7FC
VPAGTPFTVPPVLFAKITDEDLESYDVTGPHDRCPVITPVRRRSAPCTTPGPRP